MKSIYTYTIPSALDLDSADAACETHCSPPIAIIGTHRGVDTGRIGQSKVGFTKAPELVPGSLLDPVHIQHKFSPIYHPMTQARLGTANSQFPNGKVHP